MWLPRRSTSWWAGGPPPPVWGDIRSCGCSVASDESATGDDEGRRQGEGRGKKRRQAHRLQRASDGCPLASTGPGLPDGPTPRATGQERARAPPFSLGPISWSPSRLSASFLNASSWTMGGGGCLLGCVRRREGRDRDATEAWWCCAGRVGGMGWRDELLVVLWSRPAAGLIEFGGGRAWLPRGRRQSDCRRRPALSIPSDGHRRRVLDVEVRSRARWPRDRERIIAQRGGTRTGRARATTAVSARDRPPRPALQSTAVAHFLDSSQCAALRSSPSASLRRAGRTGWRPDDPGRAGPAARAVGRCESTVDGRRVGPALPGLHPATRAQGSVSRARAAKEEGQRGRAREGTH